MIISARWILPIDRPPVARGWIEISGATIAGVGIGRPPGPAHDLGDVAVLPGLVNAHTHLELSWMAGLVPPAPSMDEWIRALLRVRRVGPPDGPAAVDRATRDAIQSLRSTGTVLVGDISNTLSTLPLLHEAGLGGAVFHEILGFNAASPAEIVHQASDRLNALSASLAANRSAPNRIDGRVVAHAPYSVSPALFSEIARRRGDAPLSVHLGESPEEIRFLRAGDGPIRRALEDFGVWTDTWSAPACDPVEYMHRLGYLQPGLLAVHATHLDDSALERLAAAGATVVTCPRSNAWVGAGLPRVAHFYGTGVPVAIGTDSLASVGSLNMFDELAELRRIAPDVAAGSLLESATRIGAEALGFGRTHGTIGVGKQAALVAVDVPDDVGDVEEYLVGGVTSRHGPPTLVILARLRTYASFVRFSHSVFALPFALAGALLASRVVPLSWPRIGWIVVCMVAARSAAMGFNRLVDADYDGRNPRTAMRELPRGLMSRPEAGFFVIVASVVFVAAAAMLGRWPLILSPVALLIVFWYSLAKRVSTYTQLFLGLAMAVAPVGGWIAMGAEPFRPEPWWLGLAIGSWVAGFDVLYACQDLEFDRREGLRSIPVRFGVGRSLTISRGMHVATVAALAGVGVFAGLGVIYYAGVLLVAALLVFEQSLVRVDDLSQVKRAFDLNAWVGVLYFAAIVLDVWAA